MSVLIASDSAGFALDYGSVQWYAVFKLLQEMHTADLLFGSGVHRFVHAENVICRFGACLEVVDLDI